MSLYEKITPALFKLDPETAHNAGIKALKTGLIKGAKTLEDPRLETEICGLRFPNPVGLSAGFDKNAEVIAPIFKLGFGFVEVGTVTPKPQRGNPRPRVFRCPEHHAVINAMGFPNGGMNHFKTNVEKFLASKPKPNGVLGLNIGMNKSQTEPAKDYTLLIHMLAPMADYLTINISSPNTPGLRDLQKKEPLTELMTQVMEAREKTCGEYSPPLFVKLAPDLTEEQQSELAKTLMEIKVDGVILGNTTLDRPEFLPEEFRGRKGGLSGQPLTFKSTAIIKNIYKLTKGKLPIIGVGGISNGAQAYEKIKAGASLIQLYTGLIYKGPCIANEINKELLALIQKDGYDNISEAIGKG